MAEERRSDMRRVFADLDAAMKDGGHRLAFTRPAEPGAAGDPDEIVGYDDDLHNTPIRRRDLPAEPATEGRVARFLKGLSREELAEWKRATGAADVEADCLRWLTGDHDEPEASHGLVPRHALNAANARAERLAAETADWERRYTDLLDDVTGKNLELDRLRRFEDRACYCKDDRTCYGHRPALAGSAT